MPASRRGVEAPSRHPRLSPRPSRCSPPRKSPPCRYSSCQVPGGTTMRTLGELSSGSVPSWSSKGAGERVKAGRALERVVRMCSQRTAQRSHVQATSGILGDGHHECARLAPRQKVGVVLVRPHEHHGSLVLRCARRQRQVQPQHLQGRCAGSLRRRHAGRREGEADREADGEALGESLAPSPGGSLQPCCRCR